MSNKDENNVDREENRKRERSRRDSDTKSDGDINSPEAKRKEEMIHMRRWQHLTLLMKT